MSATTQPANGNPSFANRALTAVVTLGTGTFGQTGMNTVTLAGLRAQATISAYGAPGMNAAEMRLYGVTADVMNAVSTLGVPPTLYRHNNTLTILAGDDVNGMAPIFSGYLIYAYQDFAGMPESCLHMVANGNQVIAAVAPVPPVSFPGGADVATIMAGLALQMGLAFENNGVQVQLASPYFSGTAYQQAQKCAQAAHIQWCVDTNTSPNVLAIWPFTGTRGSAIPEISAASGLIGYPTFMQFGIEFTTLFNPNIRVGGQITMQSTVGGSVTYANPASPSPPTTLSGGPNGLWYVNGPVSHDLASQMPGGPWFTQVSCSRVFAASPGA